MDIRNLVLYNQVILNQPEIDMKTKTTVHIAPSPTEHGTQCRVYMNKTNADVCPTYSDNPILWKEVGLMNSRGILVCFEGTPEQRQEIQDCEPLMGGMYISMDF